MTTPFFLIDFENVQPKALGRLQPGASRIKVFLGQHQSKLMLELVQALQPFGKDAEYIQINGTGPDAVDFHIAYYIGRLAAAHPGATFNIISKDRGFDPLVRHLTSQGIGCKRLAEIPGPVPVVPAHPGAAKAPAPAKVAKAAKAKPAKNMIVTILPEPNGPAPTLAVPDAAKGPVAKAAATKATAAKAIPTKATTVRTRANEIVDCLRKSTKPATLLALRASIKSWIKPSIDDKAVDAVIQSLLDRKKIAVSDTKVTYTLG